MTPPAPVVALINFAGAPDRIDSRPTSHISAIFRRAVEVDERGNRAAWQ